MTKITIGIINIWLNPAAGNSSASTTLPLPAPALLWHVPSRPPHLISPFLRPVISF